MADAGPLDRELQRALLLALAVLIPFLALAPATQAQPAGGRYEPLHDSIVADGTAVNLVAECVADGQMVSADAEIVFLDETKILPRLERDTVENWFLEGQLQAKALLDAGKTAACARLTPAALERVRLLGRRARRVLDPAFKGPPE